MERGSGQWSEEANFAGTALPPGEKTMVLRFVGDPTQGLSEDRNSALRVTDSARKHIQEKVLAHGLDEPTFLECIEAMCKTCDTHLGHLLSDAPPRAACAIA